MVGSAVEWTLDDERQDEAFRRMLYELDRAHMPARDPVDTLDHLDPAGEHVERGSGAEPNAEATWTLSSTLGPPAPQPAARCAFPADFVPPPERDR